jgi:hypothetical protein
MEQIERRVLDAVGRAEAVLAARDADGHPVSRAQHREAPHRPLTAAWARARGVPTVPCACADRDGVRREIREFLAGLRARHAGVPESIAAALANVTPYTLFDPALSKEGADVSPAFAETP